MSVVVTVLYFWKPTSLADQVMYFEKYFISQYAWE